LLLVETLMYLRKVLDSANREFGVGCSLCIEIFFFLCLRKITQGDSYVFWSK